MAMEPRPSSWRRGNTAAAAQEGAREGPEAEVEAREGGRAREEGAGELQMRLDQGRVVHEDELDAAMVRGHGGGREVDAAEGVRVPGEGVGHDGGDAGGGGVGGEQVVRAASLAGRRPRRRAHARAAASLVGCSHDGGPWRGSPGGEQSCGGRGAEVSSAWWKRGRRLKKKLTCGPHTSVSAGRKQQGYFGPYKNTRFCRWVQRHQRRIK